MKLWMIGFVMGSLLTTGVSIAWDDEAFERPQFVYPVLPFYAPSSPVPSHPLPQAFPPQPLYNWQSPC